MSSAKASRPPDLAQAMLSYFHGREADLVANFLGTSSDAVPQDGAAGLSTAARRTATRAKSSGKPLADLAPGRERLRGATTAKPSHRPSCPPFRT